MNRAFCNSCKELVRATRTERDGQVYLVKDCPKCGPTETLIASDAARYDAKRSLDEPFQYQSCHLDCLHCRHKNPNLVFVDITNRCNLNCPICINNTPSMGFLFEPPIEYFDKIFAHLATIDPKPSVQLFGGEPTVRQDLFDIIRIAKSYGLPTRVVTNGLKLADEAYCRQLIETRATINIAYDGANPENYRILRGTPKALDLKRKALENIRRIGGAKVILMTLAAKGFNDHELPELFQLCHDFGKTIRGVYFMPLAHTWDSKDFALDPPRITMEDVEAIVNDAFPGERVDFLPAGLLSRIEPLLLAFRVKPLPFVGAHPNCESMYVLVSDGTTYVPMSRYLKTSAPALARDLAAVSHRLERHLPKDGSVPKGWRLKTFRLRGLLAGLGLVRRHVHIGRLFKGKGFFGKAYHALATFAGILLRRSSEPLFARHVNPRGVLQLVILPFEDKSNLETERLERCPTAFAFYDPVEDRVKHVPTCAWGLHKAQAMHAIADYYGSLASAPTEPKLDAPA